MTIGARIKERRELLQLSQGELATLCGYSDKTSISKIENAGDSVSLKSLKRIADALAISVNDLLTDTEILQSESSRINTDINNAMKLYRKYERVDPEIRKAIDILLEHKE